MVVGPAMFGRGRVPAPLAQSAGELPLAIGESSVSLNPSLVDFATPIATASSEPVWLFSYFRGPVRPGGLMSGTGRVYMTSQWPGQWQTSTAPSMIFRRFLNTGKLSDQPGYFTTGPVDPSDWGLAPIRPTGIGNFWKQAGSQYRTRIGVMGFHTSDDLGSTLLIPEPIPATKLKAFQAVGGLLVDHMDKPLYPIAGYGVYQIYIYIDNTWFND